MLTLFNEEASFNNFLFFLHKLTTLITVVIAMTATKTMAVYINTVPII